MTIGDLAVLLGRLPFDAPVRIVGHTRTDPDLDEDVTDGRTVMAVTVAAPNNDETTNSPYGHGYGHRATRPEPGVLLGSYVVAVDKPVSDTRWRMSSGNAASTVCMTGTR